MDDNQSVEAWKAEKKRKKAQMAAMQALPYKVKIKRAELRAREFVEKLDDMGLEAHECRRPGQYRPAAFPTADRH